MTAAAGVTADTQRGPPGRSPVDPALMVDAAPPLPRSWFEREPVDLARALLGRWVVRVTDDGPRIGRIVETEAYDGTHDRASHARAGRTRRTAPMFGPAGHAYVYLVYGMHHCMNVVARTDGVPGAVLLRALEPVRGLDAIRHARRDPSPEHVPDARLLAGPALLCAGLSIDRSCGGLDLTTGDRLWIATDPDVSGDEPEAPGGFDEPTEVLHVRTGPRIGVAYAGPDWANRPWRFGVAGSPSLSRPFPRDAGVRGSPSDAGSRGTGR